MKINIKTMASSLAALCLVASLQPAVYAADAEQNYAIWGEGSASCHAYGKARLAENDKPFKAFIRGYLTAYNTLANDTYNITGGMKLPEIMQWLDNYCEEKSIDSVDRALQMLITDVQEQRYKTIPTKGIGQGWGK